MLILADVYWVAIIQLTILGEHILFINISRVEAIKLHFFIMVLLQFVLG
jgi:hypothetical protein